MSITAGVHVVDEVTSELFALVADAIAGQPRNYQRLPGPSELGTPCDRRLGHRLAGTPAVNDPGAAWKPYVGTAIHERLAGILAAHEITRLTAGQPDRWHVEQKVVVGQVDGVDITGSCDLFDAANGIVIDWKTSSRNLIRERWRPHGPGEQYRAQAHLYGRGWQAAGHAVHHVALVWLTRDGEYHDRHVWHEPYDEQVAINALARATSIAVALRELGPAFTLPTLPTTADHCRHCPWFASGATDLHRACPGVDAEAPPAPPTSLTRLIA